MLLCVLAASATAAPSQLPLTVDEAVARALRDSPTVARALGERSVAIAGAQRDAPGFAPSLSLVGAGVSAPIAGKVRDNCPSTLSGDSSNMVSPKASSWNAMSSMGMMGTRDLVPSCS